MNSRISQLAFENFSLQSANAATTESIILYNSRSFELIAFRASLAVAGTINFYETIDGTNRFLRRVYHIEVNNFVSSVAAFTSGNFVAAIAGIDDFQIEKVTALASTTLTFVGRFTFGHGIDGGILGPAGPDNKDYIDCLAGPGGLGNPVTVNAFLADITTSAASIVAFAGTFPSITATIANNDVVIDYNGVFSAMDFQFREVSNDVFNYASPESRPVFRMVVTGDATNTSILYGFSVDVSGIDFSDSIGIGLSVYAVSNYDYDSNSGLLHPDDANRNWARTQATIRDSAGVAIWQANKIDIPWNGGAIGQTNEIKVDVNNTHILPAVGGTASAAYPRTRYTPTTISSWTIPGDTPNPRNLEGDINLSRNLATQFFDLEFSLERDRVVDTMDGFYQSPTGYAVDGRPDTPATPSGAITWDFSDATTLYISRPLTISGTHGRSLSADMADAAFSNAPGQGFPNPPGASPNPEVQTIYYKDIFLRRRPFSYTVCTNFSITSP